MHVPIHEGCALRTASGKPAVSCLRLGMVTCSRACGLGVRIGCFLQFCGISQTRKALLTYLLTAHYRATCTLEQSLRPLGRARMSSDPPAQAVCGVKALPLGTFHRSFHCTP